MHVLTTIIGITLSIYVYVKQVFKRPVNEFITNVLVVIFKKNIERRGEAMGQERHAGVKLKHTGETELRVEPNQVTLYLLLICYISCNVKNNTENKG